MYGIVFVLLHNIIRDNLLEYFDLIKELLDVLKDLFNVFQEYDRFIDSTEG